MAMWGLLVRPEDRVSFLEVPSSFSNAQLALRMIETPCTSQPATLQNENGEVWNWAHSCKMNAWIAWMWCREDVSRVERQNARASFKLASVLQMMPCLGRKVWFWCLRVFGMLAIRVLACYKVLKLFEMIQSLAFNRYTTCIDFCKFACFWRKLT